MSFFVFVDNSNVWIEGKTASAVVKGWAKNQRLTEKKLKTALGELISADFSHALQAAMSQTSKKLSSSVLNRLTMTAYGTLWLWLSLKSSLLTAMSLAKKRPLILASPHALINLSTGKQQRETLSFLSWVIKTSFQLCKL